MNNFTPIREPILGSTRSPNGETRLWREVMEEFVDGVMVVNRRREVLLANAALTALAGEPPRQPGDGNRGGCCDLFGCRVPGTSLRFACLTDECLARGPLSEVRVELPVRSPTHSVWIKATPLGQARDRVLFRLRAANGRNGDSHLDGEPAIGPRLGVLTLGRTKLDTPEGPVTGGWLDQRHGHLLKYFVCERHRVLQVEEIAEELWPDAHGRGPSIVRHYIHALRNQLEPWRPKRSPSSFIVLVVPGGYALNRDLVHVDADTFERLVTAGLAASREGRADAVETLERALTWYRGELMSELPYEVWTLTERERLRDLALRALRHLGRVLAERGQLDEAFGYLERAAQMQPFDTDIERDLIALAVQNGRLSVALRRYEALRIRMLRKFGEEPGFDLQDLIGPR